MAHIDGVSFSSRRECLEEFARTLGAHSPRHPIPAWWVAFEEWYQKVRADKSLRSSEDPAKTSLMVRLEPPGYDDDDDEGDEEGSSLAEDDLDCDDIDCGYPENQLP